MTSQQHSKYLTILAVIGIVVGVWLVIFITLFFIEFFSGNSEEQLLRPTTIETITEEPVIDGTIIKKFTHGDTEIIYRVGVENGIEETPPPDVLVAMEASYTEEEKKIRSSIIKKSIEDNYDFAKVIGFNNLTVENIPKIKTLQETSFKAKKLSIDIEFTCDNFDELADRYRAVPYPGFYIKDRYVGTMEGYIYWRAFHECIDPKYDEKLEKVLDELKEVYAVDLSEVNIND